MARNMALGGRFTPALGVGDLKTVKSLKRYIVKKSKRRMQMGAD
jgi:hypothetical protein